MCKLFPGAGVVGFSEFRGGGRISQGGREIQGGLRLPSELCFGTSEIYLVLCFMVIYYILRTHS